MSDLLLHPGLPWYLISGICIGLSKAGLGGMAMVSVALMAQFFGKDSIGIVLPLLIIADLMVYPRLSRAGSWKEVRPLLAPAVIGVLLGALLVGVLDDTTARKAIGWPLIVMIVMKVGMDRLFAKARDWHKIPFFHSGCGLMAGVVTMLANAAGPITTLYLLEKKVTKAEFLGLAARFFLLINLVKVPFSLGLGLITTKSLWWNVAALPAVALGVVTGLWLVEKIPQRSFEALMLAFAFLASLKLVAT